VGCESELGDELVDLRVVVALVEAECLRPLEGRLGPFDRETRERPPE
jgi:hypothetical protein